MNFLKMHTSLCTWIFILTWICNSSSDRPGCPPFDPDLRCIQFIQQCNSDNDCKEDELCCYQPACGTSCTKKVPEDKCPPHQEDVICKRYINNCEIHSDCTKGQICCTSECGRDCRPPKPDICSLPKKTGQCEALIPRYYYDTMTKSCEKFIYGGCEGNANNFETFEECKQKCDNNSNVCSLPKEIDPCEALIPRYYYDTMKKSCEKFFYGGCQGNANNFETLEECNEICANNVNVCELPMEIGPCDAAITRYFYNTNTKSCQTFIYGGCEGNANNFETLEDCKRQCDDGSYEVHIVYKENNT